MGNRAYINLVDHNLSIYLHWNGGPESVAAFLLYAQQVGIRSNEYFPARLVQIIGNFIHGTLSLGIKHGLVDHCPDNSVYDVKTAQRWSVRHRHRYGTNHFDTVDQFVESVSSSNYWTAENPIMDQIAEINDPYFRSP